MTDVVKPGVLELGLPAPGSFVFIYPTGAWGRVMEHLRDPGMGAPGQVAVVVDTFAGDRWTCLPGALLDLGPSWSDRLPASCRLSPRWGQA